ncbi:MAG TPA: hydroxymethylglutaryl-CoA reductase, partial [Prolixibacteraceae bacterium]|nr:hydroxymethylglutaryl-CoA reductase [Prolixibacteraceae bacterium]
MANQIAIADTSRAVTHNKGIYNGVDAVVLATGNDWRAAEACGHAYAAASGHYRALTDVEIKGNTFRYTLTLPIALGTVGGLTQNHPLAKLALEILGYPGSVELMKIAAAAGMANNFSAVHALITSGIQQGHVKMHLPNILNQLGATP